MRRSVACTGGFEAFLRGGDCVGSPFDRTFILVRATRGSFELVDALVIQLGGVNDIANKNVAPRVDPVVPAPLHSQTREPSQSGCPHRSARRRPSRSDRASDPVHSRSVALRYTNPAGRGHGTPLPTRSESGLQVGAVGDHRSQSRCVRMAPGRGCRLRAHAQGRAPSQTRQVRSARSENSYHALTRVVPVIPLEAREIGACLS